MCCASSLTTKAVGPFPCDTQKASVGIITVCTWESVDRDSTSWESVIRTNTYPYCVSMQNSCKSNVYCTGYMYWI